MTTLHPKMQCCIQYDAKKPEVIENRICEGTYCLNTTLSSCMTSLQLMVASATSVCRGSNEAVTLLYLIAYPSAVMYGMQTQVPVTFLINATHQTLH
jgi:hypothetical protein